MGFDNDTLKQEKLWYFAINGRPIKPIHKHGTFEFLRRDEKLCDWLYNDDVTIKIGLLFQRKGIFDIEAIEYKEI